MNTKEDLIESIKLARQEKQELELILNKENIKIPNYIIQHRGRYYIDRNTHYALMPETIEEAQQIITKALEEGYKATNKKQNLS